MRSIGATPHLERLKNAEQTDRVAQCVEVVILGDPAIRFIRDDRSRV